MEKKQIQLDDWQEDILAAKGNILLCTGRQVGKTTIFARKAAKRMMDTPNSRIIVVSLTEDQAKLIIIMILDYLEKTNKREIQKGKNKPTQNRIHLKNGSNVLARPVGTTGDAVRGFTGDVLIVDEAAKMPEMVWTASKPTLLTTAGEIWMCSTPQGKQGYFWEAFQNKNDRYKVFHISSEEVMKTRPISSGWTENERVGAAKHLEDEKKDMSDLRYGQEYLGLFLDELRRYFSDKLIEAVCTQKRPETINTQKNHYLGVDIARMGGDESTWEVIQKISKTNLIHVESQAAKYILTTQTEDRILMMDSQYDFKKIYLDAGAGTLGVSIFDHLLNDPQTKRKVVAINNRARAMDRDESKSKLLKEDLYDNLRSLMEKGYIKLLDDEEVALSLRSIQWEITGKKDQSGEIVGESRMKIFGNYSHIVEGIIRAAWCVKEKDSNISISSIKI